MGALQEAFYKWSGMPQLNQINLVVWAHIIKYGIGYSQFEKLSSDLARSTNDRYFAAV
jgi:hypothetical protein